MTELREMPNRFVANQKPSWGIMLKNGNVISTAPNRGEARRRAKEANNAAGEKIATPVKLLAQWA